MVQTQAQMQAAMVPNAGALNGVWQGKFSYFASEDIGEWSFKARIAMTGNQLSGIVVELHAHGTGDVRAQITGAIDGQKVTFSKHYLENSEVYDREVFYEGRLSDDRKIIAGTWRHADNSGPFEMELVR